MSVLIDVCKQLYMQHSKMGGASLVTADGVSSYMKLMSLAKVWS